MSRLVTLGTPNAGSPWPALETWATTLLAFGLNGLAGAFWPAGVLAGLVGALEKVDVTLDQMTAQSAFLQSLAVSPDPHRPYRVIVGNRSLIEPVACQGDAWTACSAACRLDAPSTPPSPPCSWVSPMTSR